MSALCLNSVSSLLVDAFKKHNFKLIFSIDKQETYMQNLVLSGVSNVYYRKNELLLLLLNYMRLQSKSSSFEKLMAEFLLKNSIITTSVGTKFTSHFETEIPGSILARRGRTLCMFLFKKQP
jgi:hypothetical protein